MRLSTRFSRTLFAVGMLAGAAVGVGGCSQDYALFNVHIQFKTASQAQAPALPQTELEAIANCELSIADETGNDVLKGFPLSGNTVNGSGCGASGATHSDIGHFSYSTSRTAGTLTFTVVAQDINQTQTLATGTATGQVKAYPPEVPVEIYAAP